MTLNILFLVIIAIFFTIAESRTRWYEIENKKYNHDMYMTEFGKEYASEKERLFRKAIFEKRLEQIKIHNQKNLSWKEGVNKFTDRTQAELDVMKGIRGKVHPKNNPLKQHITTGKAIPSALDYRQKPGVLTAVKDQGHCGSCWAVSSASTVESQWFMTNKISTDISIQQIASCTSNPKHEGGTGGCHGGLPEVAFQSIADNGGIASEWTYPYRSYYGQDFPCKFPNNQTTNPVIQVSDFKDIKSNDYYNFLDALANVGPFSIVVDASSWNSYEGGIFDGCNPTVQLDHAVQVVGYGSDNGSSYWVVRNSWGDAWGEGGFIRLIRNYPANCDNSQGSPICGACGILFYGSYPIISGNNMKK